MQRVLEANFLELKWTEMVKKTNKKQKTKIDGSSVSTPIYTEKNKRRLYGYQLLQAQEDKRIGEKEVRKRKKKRGSSHGPSSLLVHYICFTDALFLYRIGQSMSSSAGWSFIFYREGAVSIHHFTHERNSTMMSRSSAALPCPAHHITYIHK